jgi:LmbE family N-acetylglucosaminyl deacetylase
VTALVRTDQRPLLVVAHVDDDGIGFGIGLRERAATTRIVYLTDSAPGDRAYFTTRADSPAAYAAQRWREAEAAAQRVGVPRTALHCLGARDMEAFRELPRLERELLAIAERGTHDAIWSPAYDGGHPDHDVAAFLAARLARRLAIDHFEFALYRYHHGFDAFRFATDDQGSTRVLTADERAFKRELVALYVSQEPVVRQFDLLVERYRRAPAYDFTRRPVAGRTLYESWGWPVTADMVVAAFAAMPRSA